MPQPDNRRRFTLLLIAVTLAIVCYGLYIADSPPGGEDTVDER
jgi:hypothetical protein